MPLLVVDPLDHGRPLQRARTREMVAAILERKYGHLVPPGYVERVAASFRDDPVVLRDARHRVDAPRRRRLRGQQSVALVVNDGHEIHHVRERGYVESPVRIRRILEALEPSGRFERLPAKRRGTRWIEEVHDPALVRYLERACRDVGENESLYPYVFPVRNRGLLPRERSVLAGYYCIDTFTPIHRNAFRAAKGAVECCLTAADAILDGRRIAYGLVRPPGHHAERSVFGGFCYLNNNAVAAHYLSRHGSVAILDIDYHHGNGQQDIFYRRRDVLTVSTHGHPRFAYPYFTGFDDEIGEAEGEGFNLNLPLPETLDGAGFLRALRRALDRIADFAPTFLVVALGLDPAKGDPTGTWSLEAADFHEVGRRIGATGLPLLIVQEGGYRTRTLGRHAAAFFRGLDGDRR